METKPNYKQLFDSQIYGVQTAYKEYQKAMTRYIQNSWISDDGSFCFSSSLLEDMNNKAQVFNDKLKSLNNFKEIYKEEIKEEE